MVCEEEVRLIFKKKENAPFETDYYELFKYKIWFFNFLNLHFIGVFRMRK